MTTTFESLVDLLEQSCAKFPGNELFGSKATGTWHWITYAEFKETVDRFRAALASLGIGPGDRVAIVSDNRVEWAVAAYASYGRGAAFVPMYETQQPKEWRFILKDCGARVAIGSTNEIYNRLVDLRAELPGLERVIGLELPENNPASYRALLQKGAGSPADPILPAGEDTAGFIYTSGTTGDPKGVILSHGNICSNISAIHQIFPLEDERSLSFLPWAHSFGQTCELHALVSMGCSLAINDDIANLVDNLADVQPTILYAVPRVFNRIYDGVNKQMAERSSFVQSLFRSAIATAVRKNQGKPSGPIFGAALWLADRLIFSQVRQRFGGRLKYAVSGSAALDSEVAEFIDALGVTVYEGYGLTETSPIATANYRGNRKIGSVGKAIPGVEIEIDTRVTDDRVDGEIVIYGPNVMQGYHNRPEENAEVLLPDGGFRSGDMGRLDDEGYLYITGRIKEQYKLENGKYVVPTPLEEKLKLSPYIANVLIYGENRPFNVALVVLEPNAVEAWAREVAVSVSDLANNEQVRKLVSKELGRYSASFKGFEQPKKFAITLEDFTTENGLLTPTLKLKRRNVQAQYRDQLDTLYLDS